MHKEAERWLACARDEASLTQVSALFGEEDAQRVITWVDDLLDISFAPYAARGKTFSGS